MMTTPPPQVDPDGLPPLFDTGNILLATGIPSQVLVGKVPLPDGGEAGIATIRTPTTTLTVSLDKQGAQDWADTFAELARTLAATGLVIPGRAQSAAIAQASAQATRRANGGK
jgi:hypothetical protein